MEDKQQKSKFHTNSGFEAPSFRQGCTNLGFKIFLIVFFLVFCRFIVGFKFYCIKSGNELKERKVKLVFGLTFMQNVNHTPNCTGNSVFKTEKQQCSVLLN